MKKVEIRRIIMFMVIIMMLSISTQVSAVEEYAVKIIPSKQALTEGDEISLTFDITDIATEPGIGAVYGKLEYDKKVFEKVTQEDFTQSEGWEMPIYNGENEGEGALFLMREMGDLIKENSTMFTIKMKVLDKVASQNTEIKLASISASNAEQDVNIQDVAIKCSVEGTLKPGANIAMWVGIALLLIIVIVVITVVIKRKKKK